MRNGSDRLRRRSFHESGNQIAVFGRVGARPLSREEQQRMYLRPSVEPATKSPWWVSDKRPRTRD